MSARGDGPGGRERPVVPEPPLPGAPRPEPQRLPDEDPTPPNPDERRARRAFLRAMRWLIGTMLLLFAIGLVYRLLTGGD